MTIIIYNELSIVIVGFHKNRVSQKLTDFSKITLKLLKISTLILQSSNTEDDGAKFTVNIKNALALN